MRHAAGVLLWVTGAMFARAVVRFSYGLVVGLLVGAGHCSAEVRSGKRVDAGNDDDELDEDAEQRPRGGARKRACDLAETAQATNSCGDAAVQQRKQEPQTQLPQPKGWPSKRLVPGRTAFFIMKSFNMKDLKISMQKGMWATQNRNEAKLNAAFQVEMTLFINALLLYVFLRLQSATCSLKSFCCWIDVLFYLLSSKRESP